MLNTNFSTNKTYNRIRKALENRTNMEDDRVALLEQQLAQAKLIAEEADKKYEEVGFVQENRQKYVCTRLNPSPSSLHPLFNLSNFTSHWVDETDLVMSLSLINYHNLCSKFFKGIFTFVLYSIYIEFDAHSCYAFGNTMASNQITGFPFRVWLKAGKQSRTRDIIQYDVFKKNFIKNNFD